MASITFDTLKFVETLEKAGVERNQASAIASAVRDSHDAADVATKGDLHNEMALVRKDVEALEQRLIARIDAQENRLVIKLSAIMAGLIAFAGAVQVIVNKL